MIGCGCNIAPTPEVLKGLGIYRGANTVVRAGGTSQIAIFAGVVGGRITNPLTVADQGIYSLIGTQMVPLTEYVGPLATYGAGDDVPLGDVNAVQYEVSEPAYGPAEPLFVSLVGPADLIEGPTTRMLQPGESFILPVGCATDVWVNAATSGHKFSAIVVQPRTQLPVAYTGPFPPEGPTGKTVTINSYLYQQYTDDDNLQSLVDAYNLATQSYVDWFNSLYLPVFPRLNGALLDWVGEGLYGIRRPTLYSDRTRDVGPFGTVAFGELEFGQYARIDDITNVTATSDDVYKRIIAWHFYKGDGKHVTHAWLKRRIVRFLYGTNGLPYEGSASQVSVVIAAGNLSVTIVTGTRRMTGGALFGVLGFGETAFGEIDSVLDGPYAPPTLAPIFQEAVLTGALEMPEQYAVSCRIGILGVQ